MAGAGLAEAVGSSEMNDLKWLAIAVAIMAGLCFVITAPDRRAARHWWHRRRIGREVPYSKIVLAILPWFLLLLALGLWLWALRLVPN